MFLHPCETIWNQIFFRKTREKAKEFYVNTRQKHFVKDDTVKTYLRAISGVLVTFL